VDNKQHREDAPFQGVASNAGLGTGSFQRSGRTYFWRTEL